MSHPSRPPSDDARSVDYEIHAVDVLIAGAGAAGARTAIQLVDRGIDPADILVVGKRSHGDAHTTWARGGINGAAAWGLVTYGGLLGSVLVGWGTPVARVSIRRGR